MTLIKIDKSTIKKNPRAGETSSSIPIGCSISGSIVGDIPEWLEGKVIITSRSMHLDRPATYEFIVDGVLETETLEKFKTTPGASVEIEYHYAHYQGTFPEPDYLFDYENPIVKCTNCNREMRFDDIEYGYYFDADGDEHNADKCPNCGDLNTFDYKYQKIEEVLNKKP